MDSQPEPVNLSRYRFDNYKMVTVINPRKEDYNFLVEGRPYSIKAGSKKRFPGQIANVYIDHMIKLVAQDEKKIQFLVDPALREKYYQKLIIGVDDLIDPTMPDSKPYLDDDNTKSDTATEEAEGSDEEEAFAGAEDGTEEPEADEPTGDDKKLDSYGFSLNGISYATSKGVFTKDGDEITQEEFGKAQEEAEGAVSK